MRGIKTNKFIGIIVAGALTLVMSSIPSHVNAANSPILDSNGKTFSTLDDAIQNGSGHIILQENLTQQQMVVEKGKTIQLDLNGKKLTLQKDNGPGLTVQGSLEIKGNGTLTKEGYGYLIDNSGTLNIVNGTYTDDINNEKEQNGTKNSALIRNLGTMTIHDGTFTDSGIVIKNDDSSAQVYGNLTIKGGTYHCTSDKSFANIQNSGVATIEDGTFDGGNYTILTRFWEGPAKTTITGGHFKQSLKDNYVFANYFDTQGGTTVNHISGGTFEGNFGADKIGENSPTGQVNTTISGGQFDNDVNAFLEQGYSCVKVNNVYKVAKSATGITLSEAKKTLLVGSELALKATVTPSTTLDQVTWSSSDSKIATVNANGVITAVKEGTAIITAKVGSFSANCKVTVQAIKADIPNVDLSKPDTTVKVGISDNNSQTTIINTVNDIVKDILNGQQVAENILSHETAYKVEKAILDNQTITVKAKSQILQESAIKQEELQKIKDVLKVSNGTTQTSPKIVQYIDLSMMLVANNNEELGSLYQLNKPITYTIALPSNLKAEGKTFYVIRLHDGKADKLATTLNSDGTLSFSTDRFSTYALVYEENIEINSTDSPKQNPTESKNPTNVKTSDDSQTTLLMSIAGLALVSGIVLVLDKKRKDLLNK